MLSFGRSVRLWALGTALVGVACSPPPGPAARHAALEAERDALRSYLAEARTELVPFADVLVVIRQTLIGNLVAATLPLEREIGGRYTVRAERAEVSLRPGLARVELSGRAWLTGQPSVFANIRLLASFEVDAAPENRAALAARLRLFGVESDLSVGPVSGAAERIVNGVTRSRLTELADALSRIRIPLRLTERVELPGVEIDELTIPASDLDLQIGIDAIRVLESGIFVSLELDRMAEVSEPGDEEAQ